jgi:phi LC3 family holin
MAIIVPILGYMGITTADLTSWAVLGNVLLQAVSNPYVIGLVVVSVWQTVNDPTTAGLKDSEQAMSYTEPKK